jgi:hypothetical protein
LQSATTQAMPDGDDVTVPGVPVTVTSSGKVSSTNVAVTLLAASMVTMQSPVPVHPFDQPVNVSPVAATAVSTTTVPWLNVPVHEPLVQVTPVGFEVTEPSEAPLPALVIVSVRWTSAKFAATVAAAFIVTTHVEVPEQPPPDQPVKVVFAPAAAVKVTTVPEL